MWRFGRASYLLLSDEQEARATIALAQSLLFGDTHYDDKSDVKVYYDERWTKLPVYLLINDSGNFRIQVYS